VFDPSILMRPASLKPGFFYTELVPLRHRFYNSFYFLSHDSKDFLDFKGHFFLKFSLTRKFFNIASQIKK